MKTIACLLTLAFVARAGALPYPIVDTGQENCYDCRTEIRAPRPGQPFHGQDAQYEGRPPAYRDNGDSTVTDLNTGLMWVAEPDLSRRVTFAEAKAGARTCRVGGHDDWRLPTIKELYSLIDFRGAASRNSHGTPYIDTDYFAFVWGDEVEGRRSIDAQYWSATEYLGTTMNGAATVFGVNFADGRIKGYPRDRGRHGAASQFVRYVRGNPDYGKNDFVDNGDGTVTDRATGLQWMQMDGGRPMSWEDALAWAENLEYAGHSDWRLPNAKELQSIVDYSRAPDARDPRRRGPAIDPIFAMSDPAGWFWTGTTHAEHERAAAAVYLAFGLATGKVHGRVMNVHGAGAQRSDPKTAEMAQRHGGYRGPQGDEVRGLNYVRCVRDAE